jgi:hypothetical protein
MLGLPLERKIAQATEKVVAYRAEADALELAVGDEAGELVGHFMARGSLIERDCQRFCNHPPLGQKCQAIRKFSSQMGSVSLSFDLNWCGTCPVSIRSFPDRTQFIFFAHHQESRLTYFLSLPIIVSFQRFRP